MEKAWSHDFYRETDPAKRQQILKALAGEEEAWAEEYRNRLWTADTENTDYRRMNSSNV